MSEKMTSTQDYMPYRLGLSIDSELRDIVHEVIRCRLVGPSYTLSIKFPVLKHVARSRVFSDGDIFIVSCSSYTSERKQKENVRATGHPYPCLYSRDLYENSNIILEAVSKYNGFANSTIENISGPAFVISADVIFTLSDVKFLLGRNGKIDYKYHIDLAIIARFGSRITINSFSFYLEKQLISYINFLNSIAGNTK